MTALLALGARPGAQEPDAQARYEALALYHELGPAARAQALDAEAAQALFAATRTLVQARPAELAPDELFRTALAAAEASGAAAAELQALRWLASALRAEGERVLVLELLEPRLGLLAERAPADANLLLLEFLLVQVLREENRWPEALARIEATLPRVLASSHRTSVESMLYGERASVYLAWGLTDLARRWHARQRESLAGAPDNARRHADLLEANLLLAEMDDAFEAEAVDRRLAEMLADERLYPAQAPQRGRLLLRAGLARNERARREPQRRPEARAVLADALALASLEPYERARAELALGEAWLAEGAPEEAARALQRALAGDAAPPPDLAAIGATLRARLAREHGSAQERELARRELERAALAFLDAWARLPPREGGFGFLLFREHRRIFGELVEATLATGTDDARERAFAYVLRAQSLSSLARAIGGSRGGPQAPPTLTELRAELCPPGHGFLAFLPCPETSFLFVLDRGRLDCLPLASMEELAAAQELVLRRTLQAVSAAEAERPRLERARTEALRAAADVLLPPEARAALREWSHATLVGTELLHPSFAYEELPLADGRSLGEACALGYTSSLSTLLALLRRAAAAPPSSSDVWFVGCPEPPAPAQGPTDGLERLPFDEGDARALLAPHSGPQHIVIGDAAAPAILGDAELGRARLLQIVAHGGRDEDDERPALLHLCGPGAEQGLVRARDVERSAAPVLVILMACSTARAPSREGDGGAADLGGAFLRAGAECVLLSPLPLEFHATWRLLEAFHRELARARPPSEALQRARAELRADPRFAADPAAASVRLEGLAHRPLFTREESAGRGSGFVLRGAASLALLSAALLLVRRARRRAARARG